MLEPNIAIIPPYPRGTAFCIARPLIFKIFKASSKVRTSEHANAVYSPNE